MSYLQQRLYTASVKPFTTLHTQTTQLACASKEAVHSIRTCRLLLTSRIEEHSLAGWYLYYIRRRPQLDLRREPGRTRCNVTKTGSSSLPFSHSTPLPPAVVISKSHSSPFTALPFPFPDRPAFRADLMPLRSVSLTPS